MPEQDITLRKLEIFLGYMETMNISKAAENMKNISGQCTPRHSFSGR